MKEQVDEILKEQMIEEAAQWP